MLSNISEIYNLYVKVCHDMDNYLGKGNLIDSYFGKDSYKITANMTHWELQEQLKELKNKVNLYIDDSFPLYKKTFLIKHIDALLMQLGIKHTKVDFNEAINTLYDICSGKPDIDKIQSIHGQIDELLKQEGYILGSLKQRVLKWKEINQITTNDFLKEIYKNINDYSQLTYNFINQYIMLKNNPVELNDNLELKIVETDEGWAAYNNYLKNYKGVIEFNKEAKFSKYSIRTFLSHEAYPGHHTSSLIKECLYSNNELESYATMNLLKTPTSLIEEGIGDCAYQIINKFPVSENDKIEQLLDDLSAEVDYLATYEYYKNQTAKEKIFKLLIDYKFMRGEKDAYRSFNFIKNWGMYIPTYKYGRQYISDFLKNYPKKYWYILYYPCCISTLDRWKQDVKFCKG